MHISRRSLLGTLGTVPLAGCSGSESSDGADCLDVYDAGDQLQHRIPVDDQREYSVTVGSIPLHGVYRISATDGEGTELDAITIEFNCSESAQ